MSIEIRVNCKDIKRHEQEVAFAIQELKKHIKKDGMMQELRRREFYIPPSRKRRLKHEESIKSRKREEKKAQWNRQKGDI